MTDISINNLHVLDLPDEVLLIIMKRLSMVNVLYSLVGVCKRLDQLVFDTNCTHHLDMTSMTMRSFYDRTYSIEDRILSRNFQKIVPRICHQVNKLTIEPNTVQRVLQTASYLKLYSISFMNFPQEEFVDHLRNNTILRELLTNQVTCLLIDIKHETISQQPPEILGIIVAYVIYLCKSLVNTVSVIISYFVTKLLKLKRFSLISYSRTSYYDDLIIPLLQRMINVEELILFLSVIRTNTNYIDGAELHDNVLNDMPQLNKFTFNIDTNIVKNTNIDLSSYEDIQLSFVRKKYGRVNSHVEIFSNESHTYSRLPEFYSRCHIYSLPYQFQTYVDLNNSFQGGTFNTVQSLFMTDLNPFEYNFFQIISHSFPYLKSLYITNDQPQKGKQQSKTSITFPCLI
ncbi:unnamed protein product [Adineta ricciae]|uniref:F-box domain-containing protein n=1 Tax=Adineta ricciae TaxID=249248 RepID=A0A815KEN1_ADIRI|nr:unnamed protein product [Adineta ricciae]CAF1514100.1 unnamed protein product [Adineta ricciae]